MKPSNIQTIQMNHPATEDDISFVENNILGALPKVYKEFLERTNGMILDRCVLYDTESFVEMYDNNEFAKYAPNYLSIGNDNGDRELIMKAEKTAVMCGFLDAGTIGTAKPDVWFDFNSWLDNGCEILEEQLDLAQRGDICVVQLPTDILKFLSEMKKNFALSIATNVLLKEVKVLPYTIVKGITGAKAKKLISQTSFPKCYKFFCNDNSGLSGR